MNMNVFTRNSDGVPVDANVQSTWCDKATFVDRVLTAYTSGADNAYEVYMRTYAQYPGETDIGFVKRCAEQDYHDAEHGGCVYEDYL